MNINMIAAVEGTGGIGWLNKLPWFVRLNKDMKYFQIITTWGETAAWGGNCGKLNKNRAVVMGRKTWDSIPKNHRPLINRMNIVMSNTLEKLNDCILCHSIDAAINSCIISNVSELFVIGGQEIYQAFLNEGVVDNIYLTHIDKVYNCDRWFPEFNGKKVRESPICTENDVKFKMVKYEVKNGNS